MRALDFLSDESRAELDALISATVTAEVERQLARRLQEPSAFMTIPEAAEVLRCKRQRVDDLLSSGRLTRYKDGSRTLIRRNELDTYLAVR